MKVTRNAFELVCTAHREDDFPVSPCVEQRLRHKEATIDLNSEKMM